MADNIDELARAAYEAYGKTTGFKNFRGEPMPVYEELGPVITKAWHAAAQVAYWEGYVDGDNGNDPVYEP